MAFILQPSVFSSRITSLSRFPLCAPPFSSNSKARVRMDVLLSAAGGDAVVAKDDNVAAVTRAANNVPEPADPLIQYVILRRDLIDTWPLGSIVSQGCHASVAAITAFKDDPYTLSYCSPENLDRMRKVTVEVKSEAQMLTVSASLKNENIDHKLWIEQPENIPTCIATKPYPKSRVSLFFRKLRLCK